MPCYNCGSPHHYSDRCSKPKKTESKCHNCGRTGHKVDRCPNIAKSKNGGGSGNCHKCGEVGHKFADCPSSTKNKHNKSSSAGSCHKCGEIGHKFADCPNVAKGSSSAGSCHKCGEVGHKFADCPQNPSHGPVLPDIQPLCHQSLGNQQPSKLPTVILTNTFETKLLLKAMWGRNSALVSEDSVLFKLKMRLMDQLLINGLILVSDLDEQNRTPHININGSKEVFDRLNGSTVSISNMTIRAQNDSVMLEIDKVYHMTLVYKKGIIAAVDDVYIVLDSVLEQLLLEINNERFLMY